MYIDPYDHVIRNRISSRYKLLTSCIPQEWINTLQQENIIGPNTPPNHDLEYTLTNSHLTNPLPHSKVNARTIYEAFTQYDEPPVCQTKWEEELNTSPNWNLVWTCAKNNFLDKYLCDLNWRIIHRVLRTNKWSQRAGIIQNSTCSVCKNEEETLIHTIASCSHAFNLWLHIEQILSKFLEIPIKVDLKSIVLGFYQDDTKEYHILNFIMSAANTDLDRKKFNDI